MKPRLNLKWRRTAQIIWSTLTRFESMERRRDAAALTYTTLFALVPVLTVSYSILSALPALQSWGEQANAQLFAYVMPEGSEVISEYLQQFSQQARKLTWVGLVFLFITAFMLLQTVETQFNRIWNVQTSRSKIQTFFRYWAVLSLGPLFFGAAFAPGVASVWSICGSGLAFIVAFILPASCYIKIRHKQKGREDKLVILSWLLLAFATVSAIACTLQTLWGFFL